jgi:hypothetical protein
MFSNNYKPFKPKKPQMNYCCEKCDFNTFNKKDFNRHTHTKKHNINCCQLNIPTKPLQKVYHCTCGKIYKDYSGLWRHNKKCTFNKNKSLDDSINDNKINDKELIMMLIKQNSELLEVIKNGTHNNTNVINSNNTNCNNKSFNLQFFLNETCKDAMNIMDFVNSIKLQLSDLENVGKIGFVNGISKIIIKNLNALDETQRPVHCTDKKREVIYVKDDNKWEKDENDHKKIRQAIKVLAKRNSKLLFDFKDKYPECMDSESKYSDKYTKLFIEAYGGTGNEDIDNENKIIKNISKEIIIDKYSDN